MSTSTKSENLDSVDHLLGEAIEIKSVNGDQKGNKGAEVRIEAEKQSLEQKEENSVKPKVTDETDEVKDSLKKTSATRMKKLSEKGLQFLMETKERDLKKKFRKLEKQIALINRILDEDKVDEDRLREEYKHWMKLYELYLIDHNEFCDVLPEVDLIMYYRRVFAELDAAMRKFKSGVQGIITSLNKDKISVRSSQFSHHPDGSTFNTCKDNEHYSKTHGKHNDSAKQEKSISIHSDKSRSSDCSSHQSKSSSKHSCSRVSKHNHSSHHSSCSSSSISKHSCSRVSKHNHSSHHSSCSSSSISVALIQEKQKEENLLAEAAMLKKKQELQNAKLKLKQQEEELDLKLKLNKIHLKREALQNLSQQKGVKEVKDNLAKPNQERKEASCRKEVEELNDAQPNLNPLSPEFIPACNMTKTPNQEDLDMVKMAKILMRPPTEIKKFSGDPLDYLRFMRQFEAQISNTCENDDERMNYLLQYTVGEANRIVIGFSYLKGSVGLQAVLKELKERYGSQDVISSAFVKKALNWPVIKSDNSKNLDEFSIFLTECKYAIVDLDAVRVLEYPDNIRRLVQKFPYHLQEKWRSVVIRLKDNHKPVCFSEFASFVRNESRKANDPMYGKEALNRDDRSYSKSTPKGNMRQPQQRPYVVNSTQERASSYTKTDGIKSSQHSSKIPDMTSKRIVRSSCLYCQDTSHELPDCTKLQAKAPDERTEYVRMKGLCFGCLKEGHRRRSCQKMITCKVCYGYHPFVLHVNDRKKIGSTEERKEKKEVITVQKPLNAYSTTNLGEVMGAGEECKMAIVLLKVRLRDKNKCVYAYGFLDNGSSITLITDDLVNQIGGTGKPKKITLDTVGEPYEMLSTAVKGVEISAMNSEDFITLPTAYTKQKMPVDRSHIPSQEDIAVWPHLKDIDLHEMDVEIGLLIGTNVPDAYSPMEFRVGPRGSPHATKTLLGWIPWNVVKRKESLHQNQILNRIETKAIEDVDKLEMLVRESYNFDFPERLIDDRKENSEEDKQFLRKVEQSIVFKDGRYEVSLPFKENYVQFPNNCRQAFNRLQGLKRKMIKNPKFAEDYISFMEDLFKKDYAEKVPEDELERTDNRRWYVPHHGIYHPKKPDKLRSVFDCAAIYEGVSLNGLLLPGPNLTNNLIGVLLRFRQDKIAILGDIEAMFYQIRVPSNDTDCLRFLWWPNSNYSLEPETYRMKVHIFGATSSPSCSNAALRLTAISNAENYEPETVETILRNFYVDDCLRSEKSEEIAIKRITELKALCKKGGFNITKWSSNNRNVIESVPVEERSKDIKGIDIEKEDLPVGRALGVTWYPQTDSFGFKINIPESKATRRGILSITSSIYDPLGFASPYILPAKILLQDLCKQNLAWDTEISGKEINTWKKWLTNLPLLEALQFERCLTPTEFGTISTCQLHIFSDASNVGYGVVAYLRLTDENNRIHVVMIIGKSRVVPLKKITIPRLELTAVTVSVRLAKMILEELNVDIDQIYFWTDSQTVLGYISNQNARFLTFVANRLAVIKEFSDVNQWYYCPTKDNPADIASRGISANDSTRTQLWKDGPQFLWENKDHWPPLKPIISLENDPEIKHVVNSVTTVSEEKHFVEVLVERISSWRKIKKITAYVLLFTGNLKSRLKEGRKEKANNRFQKEREEKKTLTIEDRTEDELGRNVDVEGVSGAERKVIYYFQQKHFSKEIKSLSDNTGLLKSSPLYKLDPYLEDGLIRIGGRLERAAMNYDEKHPLVIPKGCPLSSLIIEDSHKAVGHLGKKSTIAHIRQKYWIIGVNVTAKGMISKCVLCRKYCAKPLTQKMSDLPFDRLQIGDPVFSRVGMDYFGPFEIKRGRSIVKRYGVIFTCLVTRAIHLEVAHSLDTNSCINTIRRFQSRRGPSKQIVSDNGTNLVGAHKELKTEIEKWNVEQIQQSFIQDKIQWSFNPPSGSHFGGIWERMIRTVRKVLYSLLKEQPLKCDDEGLVTLFCEVENIVNGRPLTELSNDPNDLNMEVLTPNHLLLLRQGPCLPPGRFDRKDNYVQKRWRQIQYLADVFWKRFVKEYLPLLQERQKWIKTQRNLAENDIVLLVDSTPRNSWSLGRIQSTIKDKKGLVRIVNVKTKHSLLQRPVDKLCLILEANGEPTSDDHKI